MKRPPNVLILCNCYLPGYKYGGPVKTISKLVSNLGDEINFKIITNDRDLGEKGAYPDIRPNAWQRVGKAFVYYISRGNKSLRSIKNIISETAHDLLYLNSFFDPFFTGIPLLLRRLRLIRSVPVIVAPRGEFSEGAMQIKWKKKQLYIKFAQCSNLYWNVFWQATSESERRHINCCLSRMTGNNNSGKANKPQISVVPNIGVPVNSIMTETINSRGGALKIIFLSRIAAKKNLHYALEVLSGACASIDLDIYGPVDRDAHYWQKCLKLIVKLPSNIRVRYLGPVTSNLVQKIFSKYDLFFFPTRGENFGHVILESLASGCPVLLSDQTPWQHLEEYEAGWSIPLSRPDLFRATIEEFSQMPLETRIRMRSGALKYSTMVFSTNNAIEQHRKMFYNVLGHLRA